jgi:uncharacterized membrane protein YoaK (UPF0700 family)
MADAVGYIAMGGVFAANMTGNTVLAGLALGEGQFETAARRMAPLLTFFPGAMPARLLLRLMHRPAVPLLSEGAAAGCPGDGAAGLGDHPFRRHRAQHRGGDWHAR